MTLKLVVNYGRLRVLGQSFDVDVVELIWTSASMFDILAMESLRKSIADLFIMIGLRVSFGWELFIKKRDVFDLNICMFWFLRII